MASLIIWPELVSYIPVKYWPVVVLSTDLSKNDKILANGCKKFAKIFKLHAKTRWNLAILRPVDAKKRVELCLRARAGRCVRIGAVRSLWRL